MVDTFGFHFVTKSVRQSTLTTKKLKDVTQMETTLESKNLEMHYTANGEEKPRKQSLSNVIVETTDEEIGNFGQLMGQLAPAEEALESVVIIDKKRLVY